MFRIDRGESLFLCVLYKKTLKIVENMVEINFKKVVDNVKKAWYSNMAVARKYDRQAREQSSLAYVWFANALCALQKNKITVMQASLQLYFIFLMYFVQCKSIQNIDNWTTDKPNPEHS